MASSCPVRIALWSLISVLLAFVIIWFFFYFYFRDLQQNLIARFNDHFTDFCENLPPITYREQVYVPTQNGVYEKPLAVALVDIAFAVSDANCTNILPIPNPPGFSNQLRISGIDPITGQPTFFAYIFWDVPTCKALFGFSATATIPEWQSNFQYQQVAPTVLNGYENGVLVHEGFYNIYLSIRNQLWSWWNSNKGWIKTFYITGHSLGGALSTICAYDFANVLGPANEKLVVVSQGCDSASNNNLLITCQTIHVNQGTGLAKPIHYSFAAPRSGNPKYAQLFNRRMPTSLRINNTEDIIPALPPAAWQSFIYEQTGGSIPFTISLSSLAKDHTDAYFYHLPLCAQVAPCQIIP